MAAGLVRRRIVPGDRLAIVTPELLPDAPRRQADVIALVEASLRLRIVPVPINPLLTAGERDYIVADSGAMALVSDAAEFASDDGVPEMFDVPMGRPMHYTSGTTGRPKGVFTGDVTEGQAKALWADEQSQWGFEATDRTLVHGPLCHAAPLRFAMLVLRAGGSVILQGRFDAQNCVRAMTLNPTHAFVVPSHLQRIFALGVDRRPYRLLAHAGAACPPSLKREIHEWAGADRVWEFYRIHQEPIHCVPWCRVGATPRDGRPGPAGTARLLIDDAVIWCRTPDFARFRYWGDPDKTARAWRGDAFSVGDLGRLDDDGYLFLEGRQEDLIITGGVNVYPAEVEAALVQHTGVSDVAVFGVPDDIWGMRVCAVYVGDADEADLAAHAREHLAGYKRPKSLWRVATIPHNASGKVERLRLMQDYS